ncbi:MAG: DNA gyrase C-terminal beta-propeller domain-containing protein [Luteolibacter sp.]
MTFLKVRARSTGRSIKNVLDLKPEEKIAALLRLERTVDEKGNDVTFREDAGFVFFATRNGKVKKTALNDFRNYRKAGLTAINLDEGNDLIGVSLTSGEDEIVLVTRDGMSIKFTEGVYKKPQGEPEDGEEADAGEEAAEDEGRPQIRPQGRATAGVTGIRLREGRLSWSAWRSSPRKRCCSSPRRTVSANARPSPAIACSAAAASG